MSTSSSLDMSVSQKDPLAYQRGMLIFFNARYTEDQIFKRIRYSFPSATRYEVAFWYARFKSGNTNLSEPIPSQADVWISKDLPEALLTNKPDTVNASNKGARENSAKMARVKTAQTYSLVHLNLNSKEATILASVPGSENEPQPFPIGKREHGDDSPYPFVSKAVREWKKIIEQPGVKIESLKITAEDFEQKEKQANKATVRYFRKEIIKSMIGLKKLIDVGSFETNISTVLSRCLISCMNPEILKTLHVMSNKSFDVQRLLTLPHWSHLDEITLRRTDGCSLESLVHKRYVTVYELNVTPEQLVNYRRKLLEQQQSFQHSFCLFPPLTDWMEVFKPYEGEGVKNGEGYFLRNDGKHCSFNGTEYIMNFECFG